MSAVIYVLNGPNLNLLGDREPEIYGRDRLDDIQKQLQDRVGAGRLVFRQSNHEGELVDWLQEAGRDASGLIVNLGAYTHTSVALHDALRACRIPTIEVHLSNLAAREAFRQTNYVTPVVDGLIAGLGAHGYSLALQALLTLISKETPAE